jgi:hypothetical protein
VFLKKVLVNFVILKMNANQAFVLKTNVPCFLKSAIDAASLITNVALVWVAVFQECANL